MTAIQRWCPFYNHLHGLQRTCFVSPKFGDFCEYCYVHDQLPMLCKKTRDSLYRMRNPAYTKSTLYRRHERYAKHVIVSRTIFFCARHVTSRKVLRILRRLFPVQTMLRSQRARSGQLNGSTRLLHNANPETKRQRQNSSSGELFSTSP